MKEILVQAKALSKSFGSRCVFEDLSFSLHEGERIGITGPSGSGKTTLLQILGLLDTADSGRLWWRGKLAPPIHSRAGMKLRRHQIGYVFQNYALLDNESVENNLALALRYRSEQWSASYRQSILEEAMDRVGLYALRYQPIYRLSGGEQQRVALARLILKPCSVIFADEPTGNLDDENAAKVLEVLNELVRRGKALVLVTHRPALLEGFDQRISLKG